CARGRGHFAEAATRLLPVVPALLLPLALLQGDESDRIVDALAVRPGLTAADVGAGGGRLTHTLARAVGAHGRVYATEVEQDKVDAVQRKADEAGLRNVTTVLAGQRGAGRPPLL